MRNTNPHQIDYQFDLTKVEKGLLVEILYPNFHNLINHSIDKSNHESDNYNKIKTLITKSEENCFELGRKVVEKQSKKKLNNFSVFELDSFISNSIKLFKPIKYKSLSEEEQIYKVYKKIVWLGYYNWFWNKCFSEEGYELREYDWNQYCLQRYGTTKDKDGDDLCSNDSGLIEYIDEQRKRYKYPKSVISDKNYFDYYFTYKPFYKDEPYHLITREYNFLNKEFDVIRYWTHDYLIKLRKKQKTNIEWNLNIEKTMKLINNKLFDTEKKLPSNIWNISRSYDFGRTFFLMKDYIFHKKHPSDIYTLFDCIVKWENGTLLNENDGGYQNQKPLWVRWGKIIPHFRTMGRYLIKNEGGLEWLKNDVGDYLIKRQKYYNELVGENHELSISDEHIKMITENLDVFSVQWKSEYELYELLKDLLSKYNTEVVFHYYPKYLKGQELDLFFKYKRKKIGIEYQGKQHFEPIDFFGGEESFNKTKERDERKKDLCEKNNVHLIYYNYDEEISESVLRQKIEKVIRLND
jgi:hypothetical protein